MTTKKKIAILSSFPGWLVSDKISNPGGHYAVWLVSLFERFATETLPFEIHWISFHKNIKSVIREQHQGQYFHFLPIRSLRLAQLTRYIWQEFQIRRELKLINPDLIHSWGTEECYSWSVRNCTIPKIISMQGMLTAYVQRAPMAAFQIKQSKLEQITLPKFKYITSESEWGVERCRELSPNATVRQWDYAANHRFFKARRSMSDLPCCLMAGTDSPIKNVSCAIRAFSRPELRHVRLYLAGVSKATCSNLPDNIIPLGRVSREEIEHLLSMSWCLVHPSLADTCPNIVKEARVMGVPAIVTTECGAKQYVVDGKSGFIISCNDDNALATAVLKVTDSRKTSLTMGEYDQERCRKALSADTMYYQLLQLYSEVISG